MPDFAVKTAFTATDRISPAFRKMSGEADKFGNHANRAFGKASSGMLGMVRGMLPVIGFAAIYEFANKAIDAYGESEAAIANVEAGLRSTRNAIGMTSKQFQDMAEKAQSVGIFEDDSILQNVTAQLLTFGSIGSSNFERVQNTVLDLTAKLKGINATGEDTKGFAIQLGKAMDDPVKGLTALRKSGVMFDDQQVAMIKNMVASGQKLKAQNFILDEVASKYGGANKALGETSKGMEIITKNQMGNTMELIGKNLVPIKLHLLTLANQLLPLVNKGIEFLADNMDTIIPIVKKVIEVFIAYEGAMMALKIAEKISSVIEWTKYLWMMREPIIAATKAQGLLNLAMSSNPIGIMILAIAGLVAALVWLYDNIDMVSDKWYDFWGIAKDDSRRFSQQGVSEKLQFMEAPLDARVGDRKPVLAPNASSLKAQSVQTNVNIYGQQPGTTAQVTPRKGAQVNMQLVGQNP